MMAIAADATTEVAARATAVADATKMK
jgi:hypothetical protein